MKTKYTAIAALTLLGAFASCQKENLRPDNAVKVSVSVGALTKSNAIATDDTQRQFNQGDQIAVSTNDQEAVLFQCTSTEDQTWTEAVTNKFLLWTQPTLTFSAYYPVTTGTSMTAFTVPADQSSVEKIALADYMTRQQVISRPEGGSDIQMQLERKMARVIIRISDFGSQYFDDQKTVSNVSIYSEASGIADGNPTGSSTEIQPYAQGDGGQGSTYTALVVSGDGDFGARFIQLSDGEGSTLLVKGIPEMRAGNSYTFNLVVGKNKIEVASVTVQDWTTGETLAGGQAQEQATAGITSPQVGQIIGSDGKNYAADATLPSGVTAVAMIAYVGSETDDANYNNGLAIALSDEGSMNWSTAKSTCEGKTAVSNAAWLLPSQNQWKAMFKANGGNDASCAGLDGALAAAGDNSSKLQNTNYWSSTLFTEGWAYEVYLWNGAASWDGRSMGTAYRVRACLAF